jgi:hypothetical protein
MKLVLSGDIPHETVSRVLTDLKEILPVVEVETSLQRSSEPRYAFQMIGDVPEWTSSLGSAALSLIAIYRGRQSGKEGPLSGSRTLSSDVSETSPLQLVARSIIDLQRSCRSNGIKIRMGIPLPDQRFGTNLVLSGADEESVAFSIAGFVTMLSDVEEFIRHELSGAKRSTGPVQLIQFPDGTAVLSWLDADTMSYHETTLGKQVKE